MGVADRDGGNPRYPVLISVSFMIEQILHFAFDHQQGLCVVMEVKFGDIIFTILDYLLEGDSFIGLWFVIEGREGGRKSLRKCFADHLLKVYIQNITYLRVCTKMQMPFYILFLLFKINRKPQPNPNLLHI